MNQHQGVPTTPPKYHQFNLSVIFHSFLEGCVCVRVCARVCVCVLRLLAILSFLPSTYNVQASLSETCRSTQSVSEYC